MRTAGCNMSNKESYIRLFLGLSITLIAFIFDLWFLLLASSILFYTAVTKYCLMFNLLGINKRLSVTNYYQALLPRYSPYPRFIFDDSGQLVFANDTATKELPAIKKANDFGILNPKLFIKTNDHTTMLYKHNDETYQLVFSGISAEDILLVHANNITKVLELEYANSNLKNEVAHVLNENDLKNHLLAQLSKLASTGTLIENITHQWKQPLSTLSMLLQNLQLQYNLNTLTPQEVDEGIQQSMQLINIMAATVDDFRNFFKADKKPSRFTIAESFDDVMLIIGYSLQKEDISIANNIDGTLTVEGFKNEFTQVLLNIFKNAKDAFLERKPEKRLIKIATLAEGARITLTISDTAGGIPQKYLEKIFESHFTTKEHIDGTGIGLHMSRIIIEKDMHGTIKAENSPEGASFIIDLPLAGEQKASNL